jgi:hypothetical protein
VAEVLVLGQRIGGTGTPAIYTEIGSQLPDYTPPDQMLTRRSEVSARSMNPCSGLSGPGVDANYVAAKCCA